MRMRARAHPRTHGRAEAQGASSSGGNWGRVLRSFSVLDSSLFTEVRVFLGRELFEENGLVRRGSVSLYVLFANTLPGSKMLRLHPCSGPAPSAFRPQSGEKLEGRAQRLEKLQLFCFSFSGPSA